MKKNVLFVLGPALIVLASCSGSTDPTNANVFDNMQNLQSGEYDRQIAVKDQEVAAIVANNQASEVRISGLSARSDANARQIAALRAKISAVRGEAAAARAKFSDDPAKLTILSNLENQITAVQADVDQGSDAAVAQAELARVSAAIRALAG